MLVYPEDIYNCRGGVSVDSVMLFFPPKRRESLAASFFKKVRGSGGRARQCFCDPGQGLPSERGFFLQIETVFPFGGDGQLEDRFSCPGLAAEDIR